MRVEPELSETSLIPIPTHLTDDCAHSMRDKHIGHAGDGKPLSAQFDIVLAVCIFKVVFVAWSFYIWRIFTISVHSFQGIVRTYHVVV